MFKFSFLFVWKQNVDEFFIIVASAAAKAPKTRDFTLNTFKKVNLKMGSVVVQKYKQKYTYYYMVTLVGYVKMKINYVPLHRSLFQMMDRNFRHIKLI